MKGLPEPRGACAWLVKPNLLELESVAGHALATDGQQVAAARGLIASDVAGIVVLSKGAEGVLVVTAEQVEQVAAVEVPVRSATGAGDSMVAGITLGLARGMSVGMAVRFGICAGAAAVMTPAGQLAGKSDTNQLFNALRTSGSASSRGGIRTAPKTPAQSRRGTGTLR